MIRKLILLVENDDAEKSANEEEGEEDHAPVGPTDNFWRRFVTIDSKVDPIIFSRVHR